MPQRVRPQLTPPTTPGYTLPLDLVEGALQRVGWVALGLAVSAAGIYIAGGIVQPGWINPATAPLSYRVSMWATVGLGVALWALIRSRLLPPHLMLDVSLVFEVVIALFMSLAENAVPRLEGEVIRGNSSIALWILLFALAVPASFGKGLLAALATACMGPVGLAAHIVTGAVPRAPAPLWFVLFFTNFLMAIGATVLARLIYHLGAQVEQARQMGSYQLVELVGKGGMGEVWLARHRLLARQAAIKLVRPEILMRKGDAATEPVKRFEREAKAIASLHSPHTVALYDYGVTDDGRFYFVMEYLNGLDLETFVRRFGAVPAARAIHILRQVCASLAEAHGRGLTHRDIKPRNILLCRLGWSFDFVKVLDFGLVKFEDHEGSRLTQEGHAAGTPAFMAPEAAMGKSDVDARADLYGLGCVAYWLITGQLVFPETTSAAMMIAHVQSQPEAPSRRTDNPVPACLDDLILECLRKEPAERPSSAQDVARRLDACDTGESWTATHAEEWWRLHLPDGPIPQLEETS